MDLISKSIDTLVDDVHALFADGVGEPDQALLDALGKEIADTVGRRLKEAHEGRQGGGLRMSNVGKPERQLYYEQHGVGDGPPPEVLRPQTLLMFLYGDVWESIALYLAKQSGHTVTHEQAEVTLNGVVGHMDAIIDGVMVDVKSTSPYRMPKFKKGTLPDDDPFGYMMQLAAYSEAEGKLDGAFWAFNKVNAEQTLLQYKWSELETYQVPDRIDYLREVLASDTEPDKCYADIPEGKSGNRKLDTGCKFCKFKMHCWSDANDGIGLRTFIYSDGPRHFTKVVKEPRTEEVTF